MIYLDNSATSKYKPKCVIDSMVYELTHSANAGRGAHAQAIATAQRIFDTRQYLLSALGGSGQHSLIFTSGCTSALNLAIIGFLQNFKGQDIDVITTSNEHNATIRTLFFLKKSIHINIIEVKPQFDGSINPKDIERNITKNTRLVCVCHISNVTGAMTDIYSIGKILKKRNIAFLVDSAQSLGHVSINVKDANIDFLACAGHKGLHGPQGVGMLIWNTALPLQPITFGGTGTDSLMPDQPTTIPEGYEAGTINAVGIVGMGEGARWTMDNIRQINLHTRYLASELLYALRQNNRVTLYSTMSTGVVSFNIGDIPSTVVADYLNSVGIGVRAGLHCAPWTHRCFGTTEQGMVRASIGYNNTIRDIKSLVNAVENMPKSLAQLQ